MSTTRRTTAEQFARDHHRDTTSFTNAVDMKAAPQFGLNDQFQKQGFGINLLSTSHTADRVAYQQFRRWTYVAISAIARRMMGYEFCAGDVKGAAPNAERGHKSKANKWQTRRQGEDFSRYQLSYGQIMMLPTHVRRMLGGTLKAPAGDLEVLDTHPVLDILNKPNHVQKKQEFIFNLVANLYLTGEAWIVGGEGKDSPEPSLWAIPSTWVDVEHQDGLFSGFRLRADGVFSNFEVPDGAITRMYFPDPSDPKKVISPVQANLQAIMTDESLQKAHKSSFDQGIFPKIAIGIGPNIDHTGKQLKTKPVLDGDQREQLMSAVQSVWMSSAGDGLPAVLDGLIDSIQVLQNTPVEMDYQNSSEMIKDRIFQAFGLNPIIVGEITASNKAQALVAERSFSRNVLQPIADTISTTLTDWLGPWYDQPQRLVIWLDKDEPADEDLVVKKWQHAVDSDIVTEDEYRVEMLGLEPLSEEDKATDRSKMLDNPQAWANVHTTIQAISTGKVEYEAGVAQVVHFFQVDEETAKSMLGKKPTDEEIEENRNPIVDPNDPEGGSGNPDDDDEGGNTPAPTADDADPEDSDDSAEEPAQDDEGGKSKKKRLSAYTKF